MKKFSLLLVFSILLPLNASAGQYLVTFKGNRIPSGFSAKVAASGGRVVFQHPVLSVVDGLNADSAAVVGRIAGVDTVDADVTISLDAESRINAEQVYADSPTNPRASPIWARSGCSWPPDSRRLSTGG